MRRSPLRDRPRPANASDSGTSLRSGAGGRTEPTSHTPADRLASQCDLFCVAIIGVAMYVILWLDLAALAGRSIMKCGVKRVLLLATVAAAVAATVGVSSVRAAPIPGARHVSGTQSYTDYLYFEGLTSLGC